MGSARRLSVAHVRAALGDHPQPRSAVDLVLPPLLWIMPVHVAGRVLLAAALLLPVIGTVLYSNVVFGRRSYWSVAVCLVAYNGGRRQLRRVVAHPNRRAIQRSLSARLHELPARHWASAYLRRRLARWRETHPVCPPLRSVRSVHWCCSSAI